MPRILRVIPGGHGGIPADEFLQFPSKILHSLWLNMAPMSAVQAAALSRKLIEDYQTVVFLIIS